MGIIDSVEVILFSVFYFVGDAFCVVVWCPFRNWLAHNKCCNTCSIFNWGFIGIFSPLVYIPTFWTWSIFALATMVALQWEYQRIRHPERFLDLTNKTLRCKNCQDNRGFCLNR